MGNKKENMTDEEKKQRRAMKLEAKLRKRGQMSIYDLLPE